MNFFDKSMSIELWFCNYWSVLQLLNHSSIPFDPPTQNTINGQIWIVVFDSERLTYRISCYTGNIRNTTRRMLAALWGQPEATL